MCVTHPASVRGFTLIEALIVMVVLAILAAVGIPNYSRYVTRGQLVEATNALAEYRVRMEQFYQDNRSYQAAGGGCGAAVPANLTNFAVTCVIAAAGQAYTATADRRKYDCRLCLQRRPGQCSQHNRATDVLGNARR